MTAIVPWPGHLKDLDFPTSVLRDAAEMTAVEANQWVARGYISPVGGGGRGGVERRFSFKTVCWATLATAVVRNGIAPGAAFELTKPRRDTIEYSDAEVTYFAIDPVQVHMPDKQQRNGSRYAYDMEGKPFHLVEHVFGEDFALVPATPRGSAPPKVQGSPLPSVLLVNVTQLMGRIVAVIDAHHARLRAA